MTSSLVGSEMCIRDRFTLQASHVSNFVPELGRRNSPPFAVCPCSRACHCLLYTSDAADDM
eukprot:3769415-Prorocentrum_lima.AAC.1